jgi:hypothetical protein
MNKGIALEIIQEYVSAAEWYQDQIDNHIDIVSADTIINLAFIYWSSVWEYIEFALPNNIPTGWGYKGYDNLNNLYNLGISKFPNNVEFYFWPRFLDSIGVGEEFTLDECIELVNIYGYGDNMVPYFKLFNIDRNNMEYRSGAVKLYRLCNKMPTAKNIYILSVLPDFDNESLS